MKTNDTEPMKTSDTEPQNARPYGIQILHATHIPDTGEPPTVTLRPTNPEDSESPGQRTLAYLLCVLIGAAAGAALLWGLAN